MSICAFSILHYLDLAEEMTGHWVLRRLVEKQRFRDRNLCESGKVLLAVLEETEISEGDRQGDGT